MRISKKRKNKLLSGLKVLNSTVGVNLEDISKAETEVINNLPKMGVNLEYSDYTNRCYFADRVGNEIDLEGMKWIR